MSLGAYVLAVVAVEIAALLVLVAAFREPRAKVVILKPTVKLVVRSRVQTWNAGANDGEAADWLIYDSECVPPKAIH